MKTFYTYLGLLVAVLLVYSACDSGVDILDDRIDTPPGDLRINDEVPVPDPTGHPSFAIVDGHVSTLITAYENSGLTEDEIETYLSDNDMPGLLSAMGMTA